MFKKIRLQVAVQMISKCKKCFSFCFIEFLDIQIIQDEFPWHFIKKNPRGLYSFVFSDILALGFIETTFRAIQILQILTFVTYLSSDGSSSINRIFGQPFQAGTREKIFQQDFSSLFGIFDDFSKSGKNGRKAQPISPHSNSQIK